MRKRIIPSLLLRNSGLVKTNKFCSPVYLGDPINAVRIFNEKEVDELNILDISENRFDRGPDFKQIKEIASEAFMPFGYGGGISNLQQAASIFSLGVEKIILNSCFWNYPELASEIANRFGSQSIVISIDIKKKLFGGYSVYSHNGKLDLKISPIEAIQKAEKFGAGEVFINSIDRDGTLSGFDFDLLKSISPHLTVPLIFSGGANSIDDFKGAFSIGADAVAAGAFFVFQGKHRAVLISYSVPEIS